MSTVRRARTSTRQRNDCARRDHAETAGRFRQRHNTAQILSRLSAFIGKIVLTRRIVWFKRTDGKREQPKKTTVGYVWPHNVLRAHQLPAILYAPRVKGTAII
jgi:hypothetical protein